MIESPFKPPSQFPRSNRHAPVSVLMDLDAVIDMNPWDEVAKEKKWGEFFDHLPEAQPYDNVCLDAAELWASDGARIGYSSRWPRDRRDDLLEWLNTNGFPQAPVYNRNHAGQTPMMVFGKHLNAMKPRGRVLYVTSTPELAQAVATDLGVVAIPADALPGTAKGLREALNLARLRKLEYGRLERKSHG